ncbi:MAG TPA: RNA repair transcriptional activator RtcR [Myxococcales bacterium]|jgi:transcriptional regulatory protein RtcR
MPTKRVVLGLLGPILDAGSGPKRWEKWRPTVALCQQEDLLVDRLELLYQRQQESLLRTVCEDIRSVSPETRVEPVAIDLKDPWDFEEVYDVLWGVARARRQSDDEELLVHLTTGSHVEQICLYLLAESRHLPGRLLQAIPPSRQASGATGRVSVIDLDLSRYDRLAARFALEAKEGASFLKAGIETRNGAFNRLIDQIEVVALGSKAPLLLTGPTGAGKTRLAQRIYELKKARHQVQGSLVEVNCATLRGDQAMSALFGHVKGAFTGATASRPGLLRAADGGVLFLDEIAELGADEQAMLLRALEEKVFLPMGSDKEARSDFQLVAGTNRDLYARVREGRFRADLLARLDTWTFRLPGLAERREDVEPNLEYELDEFARRQGTRLSFSKEARARFVSFAVAPTSKWMGNFRDLNAAVTRMGTLAPGGRVTVEVVEAELARLNAAWSGAATPGLALAPGLEGLEELDLFDQVQLAAVLQVCRTSASMSEAGRTLFARSRQAKTSSNDADRLRKYLARFGYDWAAASSGRPPRRLPARILDSSS